MFHGVRGTILLALWAPLAFSLVLAALMFFGAGFLAGDLYHKIRTKYATWQA
jgi:hypothetical protein